MTFGDVFHHRIKEGAEELQSVIWIAGLIPLYMRMAAGVME